MLNFALSYYFIVTYIVSTLHIVPSKREDQSLPTSPHTTAVKELQPNRINKSEEQQSTDKHKIIFERIEILEKEFVEMRASVLNQFSLIQQQLLFIQQHSLSGQSMIRCGGTWIISHDQFKIEMEIGRGALATVHEATFRGATVAAKCLHQLITASRTRRQLFKREMEMIFHFQHQNIVTFLGATEIGPPVILMELMDTNLRRAYEQKCIKSHQVLGILYDIASALYFLHTRPDPVIHHNVRSTNVLLNTQYGRGWLAKLGDLGTAKMKQVAVIGAMDAGVRVHDAPEAEDVAEHSPKIDVYSFGILILELLTETNPAVLKNVDSLKLQVQQQFTQYNLLVSSCTSYQVIDRPTMYDVIKELDRIKICS